MKLNQLLELISLPLTGRAAGHAVTRGEVKPLGKVCRALALTEGLLVVATLVIALNLLVAAPTSATSSIALTQPSNITLNLQAGSNGIVYGNHTLTINATDVLSYNVTIKASSSDNNANLTNQDNLNATPITPVGSNKTLGTNQWGYTLTKVDEGNKTKDIWQTSSTTETTILDKKLDTDNNVYNDKTDLTIYYGANVDTNTLAEGSYQATVTYTATAVPKPEEAPADLGGEVCQSGNPDDDCQVDIDANMIPVKYDGTVNKPKWVATDPNALGWYDYGGKQWANAVTVSSARTTA